MKKITLLTLIGLAALAWSCKPEVIPDSLTLKSATSATVPVEGDVVSISFNTNAAWTASSDAAWLTVSPTSGEAGDATVKASAVKNDTPDARTATVTIKAGTESATVTVTQGQLDGMSVATKEFVVTCDGGQVEIPVSANVAFEVSIPEAADWIHLVSTKGMTESKVVLSVDKTQLYEFNEDWSIDPNKVVRSANVTIKAGNLSEVVKVSQTSFVPFFDYQGDWAGLQWSFYEGAPTIIPQEGADIVIDISTNLEWYAYFSVWDNDKGEMVDCWDVGWAHLTYDANKIHLVIDPNDTYYPREEYLYTACYIDGEITGDFGGLGWFKQEGLVATGAVASLEWQKSISEMGINTTNHRLAYTNTGALLISDCAQVHAINPADGSYWKAITYDEVMPVYIDSDDAGNIIVADNTEAAIDWGTGVLLSGTVVNIWYSSNPNKLEGCITVENKDYGTVGGYRVRGNLGIKAVITGVVGTSSCWFGYDIDHFEPVPNYYGTQNQGPGPGPNTFWDAMSAAAVSVGTSLHDGVLFRGYDGLESLCYLADAYTPNWAVPYNWVTLTDAGSGGNDNQNNMDIVDFNGRRIVAYTQGFHFDYSSNAMIYIVDVTDINNVETLATIESDWVLDNDFTYCNGADVLLHPAGDHLELFAVNSGRNTLAKFNIIIN